ncbi:Auxin responsive SAUR protein [Artemisia annua]|uniref:Auxin responsive SAUR protein n=1 Tax=Artemisia annua TaxID=35608 RepID=A0A2U1Q430_ARTAN|nr:Auxin responsive SAUR protein [Artemisia annua]
MGLQKLPRIVNAKLGKQRILSPSSATETPKGYFSIYVGESRKKRFLVPLAYLRHPSFQALLNLAQDEFGYTHPMGGLTFPCKEETFIEVTQDIHNEEIFSFASVSQEFFVSNVAESSEDEFRYADPMGGLTVPCKEETFVELTQDIVKY